MGCPCVQGEMKDPAKLDYLSDVLWELLYLQLGAYTQATRLRKLKEILEPYFVTLEETWKFMSFSPQSPLGSEVDFTESKFKSSRERLLVCLSDLGFKEDGS